MLGLGLPCTLRGAWRRERDLNPRSRFKRDTRLAGEPLRPLGHLSVSLRYAHSAQRVAFSMWCITHGAVHHVKCTAATNPILNYIEFRTNPEPYMVQGVVHGGGSRIRTHVPDLREAVFKTAALNHSAIPPHPLPLRIFHRTQNLLILTSNLFRLQRRE